MAKNCAVSVNVFAKDMTIYKVDFFNLFHFGEYLYFSDTQKATNAINILDIMKKCNEAIDNTPRQEVKELAEQD